MIMPCNMCLKYNLSLNHNEIPFNYVIETHGEDCPSNEPMVTIQTHLGSLILGGIFSITPSNAPFSHYFIILFVLIILLYSIVGSNSCLLLFCFPIY